MSSGFKFVLNREGVRELMQSPEMEAICKEYADRAVESLGDGYVSTTHVGKTRANASVYAESYKAKRENNKTNSIIKAVFGS